MKLILLDEILIGFICSGAVSQVAGHLAQQTRVEKPGQGLGQQSASKACRALMDL